MDVPTVRFVLNRTAVARYGLHTNDVGEAIETAFAGATVGRIFDRGSAGRTVIDVARRAGGIRTIPACAARKRRFATIREAPPGTTVTATITISPRTCCAS